MEPRLVEHLLNIFTSFDTDLDDIWDACADFTMHLYRHKPRFTVLRSRMEGLSDEHHSKPRCLFNLSELFRLLGNHVEQKRLLACALELERGRGNDDRVARTLMQLGSANRMLGHYEEGIRRSKEALEIYERFGDAEGQAKGWNHLGWLFHGDKQLEAAEEAGSHAIKLFLDQGRELWICSSHRLLGEIYQSKGKIGKAIHHFEAAIGIASPFGWHYELFWTHRALSMLYLGENKLDDAQSHVERAKSHAIDNAYNLGCAMEWQAHIWHKRGWIGQANAEAQCAFEAYEKLGATVELARCRSFLWWHRP